MTIIEKLGITPNLTIEPHGDGEVLYSGRDDTHHGLNLVYLKEPAYNFTEETKRCIASAPETLKSIIYFIKAVESADKHNDWTKETIEIFYEMINIHLLESVEKSTEKTWEEIKELIENK